MLPDPLDLYISEHTSFSEERLIDLLFLVITYCKSDLHPFVVEIFIIFISSYLVEHLIDSIVQVLLLADAASGFQLTLFSPSFPCNPFEDRSPGVRCLANSESAAVIFMIISLSGDGSLIDISS